MATYMNLSSSTCLVEGYLVWKKIRYNSFAEQPNQTINQSKNSITLLSLKFISIYFCIKLEPMYFSHLTHLLTELTNESISYG